MLLEIPRFHRRARALLRTPASTDDQTLRDFLAAGGFSPGFVRHFMEPLVAAVWSCDPATSLDYPARYLFTFLEHHGMLGVLGSPQWRTVTGGSGTYVARVAADLPWLARAVAWRYLHGRLLYPADAAIHAGARRRRHCRRGGPWR